MATPTGQAPALNAAQAVALTLLRDGHTTHSIHALTGVTPDDLYPLAAAHNITPPDGTGTSKSRRTAR